MEHDGIGTRIRDLRKENGLSQSDFGKILNVSQDTISLWEKGKSLPDVLSVVAICKRFNMSADFILGLE